MEFEIITNPKIDSFNDSQTPMANDAYQQFGSDVTYPHQDLHESLACEDNMMNNPRFNQTFNAFDTLDNLNCYQV